MPIRSNDAAGADKIDLSGTIFTMFEIFIFSFIRKPHLIFKISSVMMYSILQKQYIIKTYNPSIIDIAIQEKANNNTGKIDIMDIPSIKRINHISTLDL